MKAESDVKIKILLNGVEDLRKLMLDAIVEVVRNQEKIDTLYYRIFTDDQINTLNDSDKEAEICMQKKQLKKQLLRTKKVAELLEIRKSIISSCLGLQGEMITLHKRLLQPRIQVEPISAEHLSWHSESKLDETTLEEVCQQNQRLKSDTN